MLCRASVLTGRNNYRGCIKSALSCDHMKSGAANCSQGPGLAHAEFTIAKAAAKAGMESLHLGKVFILLVKSTIVYYSLLVQ